jgi:hypothetical protein
MSLTAGVRLGAYDVSALIDVAMSACGLEARPGKPSRDINVSTGWGWGPSAVVEISTPRPSLSGRWR